jgi:hypothetical protein
MKLLINKDGQQLGPYSLDEAQKLVGSGTLKSTDLAWHEGRTDWTPLEQVPGYVSPFFREIIHTKRPAWVWAIFIYYLLNFALGLGVLALVPLILSSSFHISPVKRAYFESLTYGDLGFIVLLFILKLIGAVLLFSLRRQAVYFFAGALLMSVSFMIYQCIR